MSLPLTYGYGPGPWSANAVAAARIENRAPRPTAVMYLTEDRRRRSRME